MKNKKEPSIRLVFFSFGILEQGGGFENYLVSTARGLADRYKNLDITIVTMTPEVVEKLQHLLSVYFLRKQDPKGIYRESYKTIKRKLKDITYTRASSLKELADILKRGDLIYSKNEVLELAVLNVLGLKKLPPVILGVHTPIYYPKAHSISARVHNFLYTGITYRILIKRIHSIQVNNADDLRLVRQKLNFPRVKVIRQAFDLPNRKNNSFHPGNLRILFLGRLSEQKGIDLLLDVINILQVKRPDAFKVKLAGSGEPTIVDKLQLLAQNNKGVEYVGHVENDKVSELYDWTDVTVIPSKYETLSKVAIETAVAQKIAVCSDIPGPREVIKNDLTGFLLPADPNAFATCLMKIADLKKDNPTALKHMGRSAYDYVKTKFNPETAHKELYNEFVNALRG